MIDAARSSDVAAVAALEAVALGPDAWSESLVGQGIAGSLPTVHYMVAREEDAVVGYAVASVAGDVLELQRIAVDPDRRRGGIATELLDDVLHRAGAEGAARVVLEVREDNTDALGFYAARGFTELARRPRYYRDGATALLLELPLTGRDQPPRHR